MSENYVHSQLDHQKIVDHIRSTSHANGVALEAQQLTASVKVAEEVMQKQFATSESEQLFQALGYCILSISNAHCLTWI